MKKIYLLLTLIAFAGMVSCDDNDSATGFDPEKDIVVDRGADPGAEYTVEKDVKYVDVFYYIPKGGAPVDDWHWRLSGIVTHVQDFFANNLKKYYQVDKKFEMIRNVANPKYVKIHYVQGNADATYVENWQEDNPTWATDVKAEIIADINQYWQAHPSEKTGHHHLIFMPENKLNGIFDESDEFFACLSCDNAHFDIKYFDYSSTRGRYLAKLGEVLYLSGLALGTLENGSYATQNFYPLSFANAYYSGYPELIRLTEADVLALSEREAFNPRSLEPKYGIDLTRDQFEIRDVKMEATATSISISCDFLSEYPVANLLAYEDPWTMMEDDEPAPELDMDRGRSFSDVTIFSSNRLVSSGKENGKYVYHATVLVPVSFIHKESKTPIGNMEYAKSEFRLKLLMECGYIFPEIDFLYYPTAQVYPARFRYQYYWIPGVAQPYLLTDLRDHDEIIYTPQEVSSIMMTVVDGDKSTTWTGFLQNNSAPEVPIKMLDESSTVDGIRIWAPGDKTPLRVSVYVTAGGVESIVVDNRLIPGDEEMYKYIEFDRKENVSQLRVRVEKAKENETSIAEIEVYRKRDSN